MNAPFKPTDIYADPVKVCQYDGQNVYRLSCGLYWAMNAGCFHSITQTRDGIDDWRRQLQADILDGDQERPA